MQIYSGDGQKHEVETYYPIEPPILLADPDELPTMAEPNPSQEVLDARAKAAENAE